MCNRNPKGDSREICPLCLYYVESEYGDICLYEIEDSDATTAEDGLIISCKHYYPNSETDE